MTYTLIRVGFAMLAIILLTLGTSFAEQGGLVAVFVGGTIVGALAWKTD